MLCLARQPSRPLWTRNFEAGLVSRSQNPLLKTQARFRYWKVKKDFPKNQEREEAKQVAASARLRRGVEKRALQIQQAPTSFTVPVVNITTGESASTVDLNRDIFGCTIRPDIMQRVVVWKLACKRKGLGKGKNRAEMKGTSQKMGRQKGAGRARVGQRRTPVRRGGGHAFPPVNRDFTYTLPKKVRRLGLRSALATKFAQNKLVIAENLNLDTWKTKNFQQVINARGWKNALFVDYVGKGPDGAWIGENVNFTLAARNIPKIKTVNQAKTSVYDILKHNFLVLNQHSLDYFKQRIDGTLPRISKMAIRRRKKKLELQARLEKQATKQAAKQAKAEQVKSATE